MAHIVKKADEKIPASLPKSSQPGTDVTASSGKKWMKKSHSSPGTEWKTPRPQSGSEATSSAENTIRALDQILPSEKELNSAKDIKCRNKMLKHNKFSSLANFKSNFFSSSPGKDADKKESPLIFKNGKTNKNHPAYNKNYRNLEFTPSQPGTDVIASSVNNMNTTPNKAMETTPSQGIGIKPATGERKSLLVHPDKNGEPESPKKNPPGITHPDKINFTNFTNFTSYKNFMSTKNSNEDENHLWVQDDGKNKKESNIDDTLQNKTSTPTPITPTPAHQTNTQDNIIQNTNNIKNNKTPTTPTQNLQQQKKSHLKTPTPIIIDNTSNKHTVEEKSEKLKTIFKNININITFLKLGGIKITTDKIENINSILKKEKYDTDFFGEHLYIHLANKDLRPWLCINKYNKDKDINIIKQTIENIKTTSNNIKIEGLHRKNKGKFTTTLILFKVSNDIEQQILLNQSIKIDEERYNVRIYITEQQIRCTNCQAFGHLSRACKAQARCVRCSGYKCEKNNCKENFRKCANCGENHSAAYKNCNAVKTHIKGQFERRKQISYAEMTKQNMATITSNQNNYEQENKELKDIIKNLTKSITRLTDMMTQIQYQQKQTTERLPTIITEAILKTHSMENSENMRKKVKEIITKEFKTSASRICETTEEESEYSDDSGVSPETSHNPTTHDDSLNTTPIAAQTDTTHDNTPDATQTNTLLDDSLNIRRTRQGETDKTKTKEKNPVKND